MRHSTNTAAAVSRFLESGITSYHVATRIEAVLREAGFSPFTDSLLQPGDTRYLRLDGTVLACRTGTTSPRDGGVLVVAAHTDSPGLQLKHRSARYYDTMVRIPVEVYGSPILATWLDRDLTVAGRLGLRSGTPTVIPVSCAQPMAVIPNLAVHLNREANDSLSYNRQEHLQALLGPVEKEIRSSRTAGEWLITRLAEKAGVEPKDVIDAELFLVPVERASITSEGLLTAARVDNLAGCYTVLEALRTAPVTRHTHVAVFYDHEEIGSTTAYGAAGAVTEQFLRRLVRSSGGAALEEILPRTILLSNDAAHARHPNYSDKHDDGYSPRLSGGPVIKKSAVRRYASELPVSTWLARAGERAGISLQYLQNRSDIPAGSTIGPAVASRLSVRSADIGIPILAMHSIRETASIIDVEQMIMLLETTFGGDLNEVLDVDPAREK